MAAYRRVALLAAKLSLRSVSRSELTGRQTASGARKCLTFGLCLATGGAVALYFYEDMINRRGWRRKMGTRSIHGLLQSIPAVEAKEKAHPMDFEEGDVRMSSHEHRFRMFSSVEYDGQLYMTPQNFIESVTMSEPRNKRPWRSLTKQELEKILSDTPPVWRGSSKLFRNLRERGIISYTEYLFLLCILTKPHAGFKIAFNMFDADGNQMVDKREFLVLQEIFRKKNEKKGRKGNAEKSAQLSMQLYGYQVAPMSSVLKKDSQEFVARSYWDVLRRGASQILFSDLAERADESLTIDTTLLVHFFGKKGKAELTFDDFYRFMDNLQTEVLEIEFLTYSKGMATISEEDFAKILLRFTNVENIGAYLENVRQSIPDEKGITFDEFRCFFQFLNNLEDFAIAMQMYNFASRSIGQDEFARAVYVATGLKLTRHLVNTIFKIFDVDHDDQLSYKEFIGIMKDRLHRGARGYKAMERAISFRSCLKRELASR
ncbi:calcium uptake protein 3, mitochondrial isoform X3 [Hippocampus zosterae]|uniref:calcium uptake protein 3, mitochondrial isoform X2 n=1 Tax=Hippocampus zosterae TaxID=109293 RepID=UPI00223C8DB1|nr:calcium uptake protein 3, mitochondrial isoform X2 [Hippocampus zosterae]XP_051939503.1 calcium uptake protein 3, mitochondrial isoform X3 [Hippocampus zosterae]